MNELHLFDFDDTLIRSSSKIWLRKANGKLVNLPKNEYYDYVLKPGERFYLEEFDMIKSPILIDHMYEKFIEAKTRLGSNCLAILTARPKAEPVVRFMQDLGHDDLEIAAVGVYAPKGDPRFVNAQRKKTWIAKKLNHNPHFKLVHFYDDTVENLEAFYELEAKYPHVQFHGYHIQED